MRQDLEAVSDQDTEAHTGHVEHPLCHHEAHGEEEVGRGDERQDDQGQGLEETRDSDETTDSASAHCASRARSFPPVFRFC